MTNYARAQADPSVLPWLPLERFQPCTLRDDFLDDAFASHELMSLARLGVPVKVRAHWPRDLIRIVLSDEPGQERPGVDILAGELAGVSLGFLLMEAAA